MHIRAFDFCFSLLCLILCTPLMVLIAVVVKVTSSGPTIFTQVRVGQRGKPFVIFKFRTMYVGSEVHENIMKDNYHPQITPVGRWLRSTHLDELPQLWNVLAGEMSLVGPRPVPPKVAQERALEVPSYMDRHEVLPGITGLPQVKGRMWGHQRGSRAVHKLNMFYVKRRSLSLNLWILAQTIPAVLKRQGV